MDRVHDPHLDRVTHVGGIGHGDHDGILRDLVASTFHKVEEVDPLVAGAIPAQIEDGSIRRRVIERWYGDRRVGRSSEFPCPTYGSEQVDIARGHWLVRGGEFRGGGKVARPSNDGLAPDNDNIGLVRDCAEDLADEPILHQSSASGSPTIRRPFEKSM